MFDTAVVCTILMFLIFGFAALLGGWIRRHVKDRWPDELPPPPVPDDRSSIAQFKRMHRRG